MLLRGGLIPRPAANIAAINFGCVAMIDEMLEVIHDVQT